MQMQTSGEALCHVEGEENEAPWRQIEGQEQVQVGPGTRDHWLSLCFVLVSVFFVMTAIVISRTLDRCFLIPGSCF